MPDTVLFAKKIILPAPTANTLQSLNMAAAYGDSGANVSFFPGIRGIRPGQPGAQQPVDALPGILEQYGIENAAAKSWKPLNAPHKGLYGFAWRYSCAARFLRGIHCVIARDVGDALFMTALKRFLPGKLARKSVFLYEMHEILYAMHQNNSGRHDWRMTMDREKRILRHTDGLILLNPSLEEQARESLGYAGPVLMAPNGFNPAVLFPVREGGFAWPEKDDAIRLVYIGSMHKGKGVHELIQAMAFLPRRFHLLVIGPAQPAVLRELEVLTAAIPEGGERVRFTGHIPSRELRDACADAHIAVIPQQEDGEYFSPIKLTEYFALGLPVVATPLPFLADAARFVHTARDFSPQGIAAAVAALADMPDTARANREAGLEQAAHRTWRTRAKKILDFADSLRAKTA